jgi:hypothetical protein
MMKLKTENLNKTKCPGPDSNRHRPFGLQDFKSRNLLSSQVNSTAYKIIPALKTQATPVEGCFFEVAS